MHTELPEANRGSQDWVNTIGEGKGYTGIDAATFRTFLRRMRGYAIFRAILRHVKPGQTVLEAGCGWALSSFALAEERGGLLAIDISEKLVTDLKRLQHELGNPYDTNLSVTTVDIFRLTELSKTFDVIFSDGTYEHFPAEERKSILEQFRAVLAKDGTLIVAVPNLHNPFFGSVVDPRMPAMAPFTVESLAMELEQGGFRTLETGYSFVNPGFEQWVKSSWMIAGVRMANIIFRFLPLPLKRLLAAHLYCIARPMN